MKKFNGFENNYLIEAIKYYTKHNEEEILRLEKDGLRTIFAPGFFTMTSKELIDHVNELTKKIK
tara:strand:+ start:249 stop:440 length:192 start_codon:yes stop_codon:yes gene_type:complete